MSANSGTLPSTKGESSSTSSKTTKLGYDHLDINKLYKGKSAEPAPKTVTQKHGMQTLGKAPPARRAGALTLLKSDTIEGNSHSALVPLPLTAPIPQQLAPSLNQQQPPPGWVGNMPHPMGPPPPPLHNHNVPGVPLTGPPHLDKKWTGGMQRGNGNFPSQRFAQDFPSLEATGEPVKGQIQNSSGPPPGTVTGLQSMSKAPDNQYGPGPILRPQTEGSWTQGGGMQRPHGPMQSQNVPSRDFVTDRSNLGGPTPPPMSLGQAGPIPPPLGVYPMSFRGMPPPPYMYQGSGPPGPGNFYPPGPGIRYGMPIPPGAPPPGSYLPGGHPGDGRREDSNRGGKAPSNQMRPGSHFTSTSIIKKGEMERMDEIGTQEGGWASTNDAIDYNKKINFSDEEEGSRDHAKRSQNKRAEFKEVDVNEEDWDRTQMNSEKQQSIKERERDSQPRYEPTRPSKDQFEHENDDDRNKRKQYENKDRDRERDRGGRRPREDDWRSVNNRYDDDRGRKLSLGGGRTESRGPPQDFQSSKYPTNLPPRFQRQNIPPSFNQLPNQRQTPSPVSISTSGNARERDRDYRDMDWERDRDQQPYRESNFKILERRKTESESSREGRDSKDLKRNQSNNDHEARSERFQEMDHGKSSRFGTSENRKGTEETSKSGTYSNSSGISNTDKEVNDLDILESRTVLKDNLKMEDAKIAFRSRTELSTSSWADEVEDEEYSKVNEDMDTRKGVKDPHQLPQPKRVDERERRELGPRRVFIHQRKVENLVTHTKPEAPVEQKVQPQPKMEEKAEEKCKIASAWGDRTKEKDSQEREEPIIKDKAVLPEKEIEKSSSRDSLDNEKHKKEEDKSNELDRHKDFDKQVDSYKPKEFDKHREHDKQNKEFVKHKDNNKEVEKRERDRPDRDDYEARGGGGQRYRRDRKPATAWNERDKVKLEKDDLPIPHPVKEKTPEEKDKESENDKVAKEQKETEKKEKEEGEGRNDKGQRGTRNRERGGCPVYQARGAWGNPGRARNGRGSGSRANGITAGGAGGGNASHYYDKTTKRLDSDRDRDEKENSREPAETQVKETEKEKLSKELIGEGPQEFGSRKDLSSSQEDKATTVVTKKFNSDKDGEQHKKTAKSPSGGRRNTNARGGSRLQGYGPPTDRNPFSSNNAKQDEEPVSKEKSSESHHGPAKHGALPVTSGPVPLMALGEISPPEMPSRSRHHGGGYGHAHNHQQHGGRSVPPRLRGGGGDPSYSFRGGNSNVKQRSGGGGNTDTAKPLMSLNSNDLDREWVSESESEAEGKKGAAAGTHLKKESLGNKAPGAGSEKYRQNQNSTRSSTGKGLPQEQTNSSSQDSANNNRGVKTSGSRGDLEQYSTTTAQSDSQSGVLHESPEPLEGESTFHEVRNKKAFGNKDNRNQKETFEKTSGTSSKTEKVAKGNRVVKNPPYDPRPQMPPRFLAAQQQRESPPIQPAAVGTGKPSTEQISVNSFKESAPAPHGNAWEKPITASLRPDSQISNLESKEVELKLPSHVVGISGQNLMHPVVPPIGQGSGNCPPVQTMIFENTNFKSGVGVKFQESNSKAVAPSKILESQGKKEISCSTQLEMSKEFPLTFGEDTPQLDFGSSFSDPPTSSSTISSHAQVYKPSGLLQSSRSYGSHQSSPISPLAADLSEKIQAVKSMWDFPTMPSVAEQSGNSCGSEEDSLPSGFSSDAFKRQEPPSRDYGQSLQQTSSGFAAGSSPAVSVIAKPDSRSSPNSINVRQIKPPQQNLMDPQNHAAVSSSPFAYGLAQQHQGANTFGMRAVSSPPALMYGSSHTSGTPGNAMYQTFPQHVDSSQVVGSNHRSQFPQYTNAQVGNTGGASYLGGSLFLPMFESHYSHLPGYHTQHQHQQQAQGIAPVQVQSQNSRISPGPMPMTSASAGVVGGAVMMNSNANSLMNMKSGQPGGVSHQNIGHQVHPGNHQQGYSQFGHPHMGHPQHHLGPVGHQKQGYSQSNMPPQNPQHLYIPFDSQQQPVINLGQSYLSGGLRSGHGAGPPPAATPPVQGLPSSSPYYSSTGNQSGVYPGGSSQGGNLQPLHVTVASGPQGLQNLRMVCQKKKWNPKPHFQ